MPTSTQSTDHTPGTRKESRADKRARIDAAILGVGRAHLASYGAAALSLRAIARELGMVSSAIYRYVDSRDELLTRLLVEAYDDLADAVEAAMSRVPPDDHHRRLTTLGAAFRAWATADPSRFALLYGSPVPGYQAPPDRTVGPGTRVIALGLAQFQAAALEGALQPDDTPHPQLTAAFDGLRATYGLHLTDGQITRAFVWWAGLVGIVGQEVFDGYGDSFEAVADALFAAQMTVLIDQAVRAEHEVGR